jgi:MbtH protein
VHGETKSPASEALYDVVVNEAEQYSLWPTERPLPSGWTAAGKRGSEQECLDHIGEVWTDLRPRSSPARGTDGA